jgi:hypothetical protein
MGSQADGCPLSAFFPHDPMQDQYDHSSADSWVFVSVRYLLSVCYQTIRPGCAHHEAFVSLLGVSRQSSFLFLKASIPYTASEHFWPSKFFSQGHCPSSS